MHDDRVRPVRNIVVVGRDGAQVFANPSERAQHRGVDVLMPVFIGHNRDIGACLAIVQANRLAPYISRMPDENLAPDEREAVLKLLRDTIAADKFPLSPRIRTLRSALAKLDPAPPTAPEPYPPAKAWVNSSIGQRKGRARR
jgi:hypothetical protein